MDQSKPKNPEQLTSKANLRGISAWAQLFRLPNLFTVPGDPMAGLALAAAAGWQVRWIHLLPVGLASLFVYCAGLIQNDLHDYAEDRRERPYRPLPSGAISMPAAGAAFFVCLALGVLAAVTVGRATVLVAGLLLVAVTLYNNLTKRVPVLGPVNMGLCRGLSLMLGASAAGWAALGGQAVLAAAGGLALYVAAVTALAAGETKPRSVRVLGFGPAGALVAWFAAVLQMAGRQPWESFPAAGASAALMVVAVALALWVGTAIQGAGPAYVPKAIGRLLRVLIAAQAAMLLLSPWPAWLVAGGLLAAWPVSALAGRRFYAS